MKPVNWNVATSGDGYWSSVKTNVSVVGISLIHMFNDFGELRVFFDPKSWSTDANGLIYTDSKFEEELLNKLRELGLNSSDVSYSEQEMQGFNYVSFDVGSLFIDSWDALYNN